MCDVLSFQPHTPDLQCPLKRYEERPSKRMTRGTFVLRRIAAVILVSDPTEVNSSKILKETLGQRGTFYYNVLIKEIPK